ncbi:hypothetical protein GFL91_26730 [Rhizobium leguminosarum bv. viciae]|uniref:Alpha/beta hydrolase n=2 Tax=Rhizobium leguminosarum TaxID=384 RepID=A0A8I2KL89_RHILV|nr:hypothetical protein [Rhizobium leguminosarum]MBY5753842.1 hypothetical protein [Rhizobium leguminosarum]MBY5781868.1 hypothetical protein [Rhizobium leguminosarum]MBY5789738.1 hypothetical protein [Rhizobium leguminosarum]MBY5800323.1 hypothetical protein [Rhizobium leguminosarum]NKM48496.1 hypothetical protein [Rhizobium leguminosarum bv. viciae]
MNRLQGKVAIVTGAAVASVAPLKLAYSKATEPKELHWVKGAGHVDLYDRVTLIPFDKLKSFFDQHLAA